MFCFYFVLGYFDNKKHSTKYKRGFTTGSSLTLAKMLRAEKRKQQAKMHQKKIIENYEINFFKQLWKVVENTKVVHYFDNSKGKFFSRPKSQWFG